MSDSSRRPTIVIVVLILLVLLALLLARCHRTPSTQAAIAPNSTTGNSLQSSSSSTTAPDAPEQPEILTPATLQAPAQVIAGSVFSVKWIGPNNKNDFVTIVSKDAPEGAYTNYRETHEDATLELTATIQPGEFEVRYVAARSKKVLGRTPITIVPATATLSAPSDVFLGAIVSVEWTGPNNKDDYLTIVAKETPDSKYDNFSYLTKGSPVNVSAPVIAGDAEIRYVTGQGAKVLARRPIQIKAPDITLSAPADCISGSTIAVGWSGGGNEGDYITIVPKEKRAGEYGNYTYTTTGQPLKLLIPIMSGEAELRYMTGQGGKVLARKTITIVAPRVTLSSATEAFVATELSVEWEGPNYAGDYITIVPKTAKDGQYGNYTYTSKGSPLKITVPKESGETELRYMTGQGGKVLARRPLTITH